MFGSDLKNLHRGGELLEREIIIKEDSLEVVEVIAKEIDDKRQRRQQQKNSSSSRTGYPVDRPGRPDVNNVHKLKLGQPVGRPTESTQLSVGHPVDRPVDRWKGRSTDRSTDSRVRVKICCFENLCI